MKTGLKDRIWNRIRGIPLTPKMLLITALMGLVVWAILDYIQTERLSTIFEAEIRQELETEAGEYRLRFDRYLGSYEKVAKIITSRSDFLHYVWDSTLFMKEAGITYHSQFPEWLPPASIMRHLAYVQYAFLLDGKGNMVEVYQGVPEQMPRTLLRPSERLLLSSEGQSYMTGIEGKPFLITSDTLRNPDGSRLATLMLAVRLDEDFLIASGFTTREVVSALVSSRPPQEIVASSQPDILPPGTALKEAENRFLTTSKTFFDYGSSDLLIGYASFIPIERVEALTGAVVSRIRQQRALLAAAFISLITAIMYSITKRISRLTGQVTEFSERVLGGAPPSAQMGDQIDVLKGRFEQLTKEVQSSTEGLRRARDELETRVEERTAELSESEERFRALFNQASDAILLLEPTEEGVIIDANAAACEMHDYQKEELLGNPIGFLDDPEGRRLVPERIRRIAAGEMLTFEVGHVRKDGSAVPVEASARLIKIGEKSYVQAIYRDITDRRQAEEKLRGLVSTLNTLVVHMPDGVILLDAENRIALSNPLGESHLRTLAGVGIGDSLERLGGRPVGELLISPPLVTWHEIESAGRIFEVAGRSVDGRGMVLVVRDVTEEREIKDRVQMHARLAAVGQLAAGIAHDFNNILTVITGYAEMLQDIELPEEARGPVSIIQQSGQRATELIGQILDFSRKTVGELKSIDFVSFVREFSEFIKRAIPENIHISFDYALGQYTVRGDATKLQQVLANLSVNARDAMPEGGELKFGLSRLSLGPRDRPPVPGMSEGNWAVLSVGDTGTGIEPEVLPHIFEPFFTTRGAGKGAGLGLSQVYGILKQHGGYVDVRSEISKGSIFTVYLPLISEPAEVVRMEERAAEMPRGMGETILVVEDEATVRDFIKRVLSGLGYKLIAAENGRDALRLYEEHADEIGLVVTDLVMPEMGGVELAVELKARKPALKLIALSGYPMLDEKELLKAGFEEFIKKPFQVRTIAEAVRRAIAPVAG